MFEQSTMDAQPIEDTHACLAGAKCRAAELVDGKRIPADTEKPDSLCDRCERAVQRCVEYLPRDYVALSQAVGERGRGSGQRVKSSPARQAPLNVAVVAAMQEIAESLDRAAEIVSDKLACNPPEGAEPQRVSRAALMVSTNIGKLLTAEKVDAWEWQSDTQHDDTCNQVRCDDTQHLRLTERTGIEFGLSLHKLHKATNRLVGELEKLIKLSIACVDCAGTPPLFQEPDNGVVFCRECNRDWSTETFALLGEMLKQQEQEEEDMAANEELQKRAELAEWCLAEKIWQFGLALQCTEISAAEFAKTVLTNTKTAA